MRKTVLEQSELLIPLTQISLLYVGTRRIWLKQYLLITLYVAVLIYWGA
jgi:hypothetical protein